MNILLIEDDPTIASFIRKGLRESGYFVEQAIDGEEGYLFLSQRSYDAAIVDVMLPRMDGFALVGTVRKQDVKTPILFLSAKREVDDRVHGLEVGGDDYLVKPFAFAELLARLQALIRRTQGIPESSKLVAGELRMDLLKHKVTREGRQIELQPREFALLRYLLQHQGKVVSKTMIVDHVWDYQFDPETNVVEACICRLRNKLDEGFDQTLIRTIRGVGYVLEITE